ncbi:class I SAM-dependent methyltransferase [Nocardia uniformis]|uniref:Class I SAM-dependent methyltransferase n=1 Tax=Nocardia uniformis TaxID=53432 RepID=A0A849C4H2_9NOCA|nr:class I SAM-dependent methyltransferase [Nocardia uniformis]NNH71340.1 class I SAM-dependent methyltransferase [Nocardia uniformis]
MPFTDRLIMQFAHPRGPLGALAGVIMAHRSENVSRGRWAIDRLAPAPDARILELGYGPGVTLRDICRRVPDGHIVAVDSSPVMLRQAGRRNRQFIAAGRLDLRLGDAAALDPEIQDLDLIYGFNVWHLWDDGIAVITDLAARLRPGGQLALAYMRPPGGTITHGQAATRLAIEFSTTTLIHIETQWMSHKTPAVLVTARRPQS